jgi:hypothetical protein
VQTVESAGRSDGGGPSSAAEPVVPHHGREERVQQSPGSSRSARGVEVAWFLLETSSAQTR